MNRRFVWTLAAVLAAAASNAGCAIYMDRNRDSVLLQGIDVDQTLDVASDELDRGVVLGLWAMRDQVLTPDQAGRVSDLYFSHIERIDDPGTKGRAFNVWHLTWAISNMYRQGDEGVKAALEGAYGDAGSRVASLGFPVAGKFYSDDRIYLGDFHGIAHVYAQSHLVVPGNDEHLQCYEEYVNPWKWCP